MAKINVIDNVIEAIALACKNGTPIHAHSLEGKRWAKELKYLEDNKCVILDKKSKYYRITDTERAWIKFI